MNPLNPILDARERERERERESMWQSGYYGLGWQSGDHKSQMKDVSDIVTKCEEIEKEKWIFPWEVRVL